VSQIYTNNEVLVKPVHFLRFSYRFSVKIGLKLDKIHRFYNKTYAWTAEQIYRELSILLD